VTGNPAGECLAAEIEPRPLWFFASDRELHYPQPSFDASWAGGQLTIRARSFLRDLCVFIDHVDPDATINEQLVTLFPGDAFTFAIKSKLLLTRDQLTSPPVFRCVNAFGALPQR